jgi:hypothetical protein
MISFVTEAKKIKFSLECALKAQMGSRDTALLLALDVGGWSVPQPVHVTPGKDTLYPLYRRLGGLQGQSNRCRKSGSDLDSIPAPL